MKNENVTLKQHLEQLVTKLQHLEDKRKEDLRKQDKEEKEMERGVQGGESCRGEGEGRVRAIAEMEKREKVTRSQREAGVGEEVLCVQGEKAEPCGEEMEPRLRGEAEGGQKDRNKREKEHEIQRKQIPSTTSSDIQQHLKSVEDTIAAKQACVPSGPDVELLTNLLQEAQEEADRQAALAQDLRSKLAEQSRKSWEAEQRLVVVEAELQRLKKAAECLGEARRQIEVRLNERIEELKWRMDVREILSSWKFGW